MLLLSLLNAWADIPQGQQVEHAALQNHYNFGIVVMHALHIWCYSFILLTFS